MPKWIVHGLIPQNHIVLLLGTPHSCKSWFLDHLAVCALDGSNLLGEIPTAKCSVVMVDEDTPRDVLLDRLHRLSLPGGTSRSTSESILERLKLHSMEGIRLSSSSQLTDLIQRDIAPLEPPVLVLIDSLSSVMQPLDQNKTRDALEMTERWSRLKGFGCTIVVAHHLSQKKESSYEDFDFTLSSMGNTQLVAHCDTAIGLWKLPPDVPTRFVLKPKPRRTSLLFDQPLAIELVERNGGISLCPLEEVPKIPSQSARYIIPYFLADQLDLTVKDLMDLAQGGLSDREVREGLRELEHEKVLVRSTERHRRFRYSLNPQIVSDFSPTSSYQEELLRGQPSTPGVLGE